MSIRMIPRSVVSNRVPHTLRDLAATLGKKIDFVTQGEATELDKGLVEKTTGPLTHLVRNSCDRRIELPTERRAKGKPEIGSLKLAKHHGNWRRGVGGGRSRRPPRRPAGRRVAGPAAGGGQEPGAELRPGLRWVGCHRHGRWPSGAGSRRRFTRTVREALRLPAFNWPVSSALIGLKPGRRMPKLPPLRRTNAQRRRTCHHPNHPGSPT